MNITPATALAAESFFSVEMWGGATFDVAYNFYVKTHGQGFIEYVTQCQMCFYKCFARRQRSWYTNYPDNVIKRFVNAAANGGIDVFKFSTL